MDSKRLVPGMMGTGQGINRDPSLESVLHVEESTGRGELGTAGTWKRRMHG